MPALTNPKRFYVYELINPRNGAVFYVGKGTGQRAWSHAKRERAGREPNALKAEVLGQIRRAGLEVVVRIVEDRMTDERAYRLERSLIVRNHATLTNVALGNRTALERVQAEAREGLAQIKPLCVMVREGSTGARLRIWARIVRELTKIATADRQLQPVEVSSL